MTCSLWADYGSHIMFTEVHVRFPNDAEVMTSVSLSFTSPPSISPSLPLFLRSSVCFPLLLRTRASALVLECMLKRRDQSSSVCAAGMKGFIWSRRPAHVWSPYVVLNAKQEKCCRKRQIANPVFKVSACILMLMWIWHSKLTTWIRWNVSAKYINKWKM